MMDNASVRIWLDAKWHDALATNASSPGPEQHFRDDHRAKEIEYLVNSKVVSIRYALLTQIIGKIADPSRSLMWLQTGAGEPGAWNARSFCDAVIVPWVGDNHDVIGTSAEPYASKPLRRLRLSRDMENVRNKGDWDRLVALFESLDDAPTGKLQKVCIQCLIAVARRLSRQSFKYQIPARISVADMLKTLETFLSDQSGGLRPMAVTTALMRIVGEGFGLFGLVKSQGVNEADVASGVPGDVMCYTDDGRVVLVVEVKDRKLTLADVRASSRKARQSNIELTNFLFASPGLRQSEKAQIGDFIETQWASGLNLYQVDLLDLAKSSFVLLDETWRPKFLREIGVELDYHKDHEHRRAWHDLLAT